MNDLDRQLAELALINKSELHSNSLGTPGKKIGPAVPPKPKKAQPQVSFYCNFKDSTLLILGSTFYFSLINSIVFLYRYTGVRMAKLT